ncbi:FAD-binding oxidoreductase [Alteromonas aestuariivivens]|uniref:D-2-hydroxyglutarate dehydrogenase n=1 Tax=Alteromonas aestuariivivens TaxID=1938339 RepID=A0A3D8M8S4_9ALTE|nr:FAD-binding and (Fe-S)-binding domain-containing protein [Alteromonas aestuariivivens]RDV26209.1 FAD-binding oxidoreductase [Alteromonas aestuariivivens]
MSLPRVAPQSSPSEHYQAYLTALAASAFAGDIEYSYGSRLAVATDNSVYQKLPQAVLFPKSVSDLRCLGELANQHPLVKFSARGGGTGTNGQSLTDGIVVDLSRHMNQILEINVEEQWVRVQAGVVKDALNDFLRPYGFFFSPDLSTSNRATIGGMINTDASGQGSLVYGKTSDHVLELTSVLANGECLVTAPMTLADAQNSARQSDTLGRITRQVLATCVDKRAAILAKFPRLNRFLTGYDLEHAYNADEQLIDISRLITGSEGSLVMVAEAKLSLTPIARHKALVNVKYDSFESALRHAPRMIAANATSVETVDSKVLNLARTDIIWHSIEHLITSVPDKDMLGLNMVEYNSNDEVEIQSRIAALEAELTAAAKDGDHGVIGYQVTYDKADISKIYAMRKKAVGLLGKTEGSQKPLAFAEDTAVPPENLADFILEFRALLDSHGLQYGMFGHVDAGVLHVRPALDLCDPEQEKLMHLISDQVVALVAKYGGLMWGEHGKGYRSEYGPAFFGEELFTELRRIKAAFDPHNKMNPGKICTPVNSSDELVRVSDTKRATYDRTIPAVFKEAFAPAMECNGNGLCFNYDVTSPMCPSSKITRDRRHSPKGRAGLIREWLRLMAKEGLDLAKLESGKLKANWWLRWQNSRSGEEDFSHEVLDAMNGCLACKSCSSQCPVKVDVPEFRARFLAIYYQRYMRPFKDYMVANIERMAPLMAKMPLLVNSILKLGLVQKGIEKGLGYVDTPLLSVPTLEKRIAGEAVPFDLDTLEQLEPDQRCQYVLVVQDPFTSFYDAQVVADLISLIRRLGLKPVLLPFKPNGKPEHVKGFLQRFANTARSSADFLNQLHELGMPMVGVDASLVLCYRDEYSKVLGDKRGNFHVQMVHEWLLSLPDSAWAPFEHVTPVEQRKPFALFSHCTEKTALPKSEQQWQSLFARLNQPVEIVAVGCCGMAGTYGHEADQKEKSLGIYGLSWQQAVNRFEPQQILASGYSCRSQVKRQENFQPQHPLQGLLSLLD